jgi:hypothetical protein
VIGEPSIEELLSEPIVRLLMASDGVAPADLRRLCIAVRARLRAETMGSPGTSGIGMANRRRSPH